VVALANFLKIDGNKTASKQIETDLTNAELYDRLRKIFVEKFPDLKDKNFYIRRFDNRTVTFASDNHMSGMISLEHCEEKIFSLN